MHIKHILKLQLIWKQGSHMHINHIIYLRINLNKTKKRRLFVETLKNWLSCVVVNN